MRKRLYFDYPDEPTRWVVSYADFITMLLALFIVLYAISQLDIAKMKEFTGSLKQSFKTMQVDTIKKKKELNEIFATTNAKIKAIPIKLTFQQQIENLKEKLQEAQEKSPTEMIQLDKLKKELQGELFGQKEIKMANSERGLVISLADRVLFDPGSSVIKPEALPTLEKISQILEKMPNSIRIEGHTDNQPINTSQYPSNWELSTARATSIVKLFISQYKFPPEKISAAGYGEFRPIASNTTLEGRQSNRRVDIVVLSTASQIFEPENVNNTKAGEL